MSEIKLRADEARDMAAHVQTEAGTARDQMDALRDYLNNLSDSFTGQAATAFDNTFNDWKQGSDQMLDSLEQLGEFLNQAATAIEDTDAQIASQLGG
jgi:WXG100 family type VII secretion target